jgi:hypothetical protein
VRTIAGEGEGLCEGFSSWRRRLKRLSGFSPTTQRRTALETIGANLGWVPPLVGWARERRAST